MPSFPRARGSLVVASTLTALALAACSDTPTAPKSSITPESASLSQSPQPLPPPLLDVPGLGHIMHTKDWFANDRLAQGAGAAASGLPILYHGGPVLQAATRVAAVYWSLTRIYANGPIVGTFGPGSADASLVGFFLNHLGGSPYYNINATYTNGAGQHIVNSVTYTQYWANAVGAPTGTQSVSNAQMVNMLQLGFTSGALKYDPATLYAIFTAGKVNLGGGFGTQYCAYHTRGTIVVNGQSRTVLFAAMPYDYAYPSACTSGFAAANGGVDPGADYEVNTLAHETEETTTDELGNAWFDARGFENADKCAWTWGATYSTPAHGVANMVLGGKNFLVQRNWLETGGCALSH